MSLDERRTAPRPSPCSRVCSSLSPLPFLPSICPSIRRSSSLTQYPWSVFSEPGTRVCPRDSSSGANRSRTLGLPISGLFSASPGDAQGGLGRRRVARSGVGGWSADGACLTGRPHVPQIGFMSFQDHERSEMSLGRKTRSFIPFGRKVDIAGKSGRTCVLRTRSRCETGSPRSLRRQTSSCCPLPSFVRKTAPIFPRFF